MEIRTINKKGDSPAINTIKLFKYVLTSKRKYVEFSLKNGGPPSNL